MYLDSQSISLSNMKYSLTARYCDVFKAKGNSLGWVRENVEKEELKPGLTEHPRTSGRVGRAMLVSFLRSSASWE